MHRLKHSHIVIYTDLLYACAHFVIETNEKYSLNSGFEYDLMMIRAIGLLCLGHPVYTVEAQFFCYVPQIFHFCLQCCLKSKPLPNYQKKSY